MTERPEITSAHMHYLETMRADQINSSTDPEMRRFLGAEWDQMLATHDAEVREHARHEFCDARLGCVVAEEPEWEYVPGWIAADGRARISQGVIAPSYVSEFIAEGGDVVRRRVSRFEAVTADMVSVKQEGADDV